MASTLVISAFHISVSSDSSSFQPVRVNTLATTCVCECVLRSAAFRRLKLGFRLHASSTMF
eukprot:2745321-Pyramimonas_sp.AAC.2